jgi:excisionase family DNA binding protein
MKHRNAQFGVRKNPDSPRVHGSRLRVNSVPNQPQEQAETEEQHEPTGIERPITCEEASKVLRVHPRTIKRMARRGEVPGHFRFGRWFFYPSELDSWMRTELNSVSHP